MSKQYYSGKQVWIFGGSSGIGLAAAQILAHTVSRLHLFARREDVLAQAHEQVAANASGSVEIEHTSLDVCDDDLPAQLDQIITDHGCPDVVINCTGAAYPNYFENISKQQFRQTLDLNVVGVRNIAAALVPHMKARGSGHLINTSSMAGIIGVFGYTDYSASKFAIVGFSEALQAELKPHGLIVSVLYPPDTYTPGFETEEKTKPMETRAVSAANRPLEPEQVAEALIKQIPKGRFHIFANWDGRITFLLKRFCPSLVNWVLNRTIEKAQR